MPISGSLLTFTVAFSTTDFTSGLLTYVSTTPYLATYGITPSNVTETIQVYSPADHWGTPFGTTSIVIGTTTTTQFALPKSGGVVIQGEYLVVVTATIIGGTFPGVYPTPDMPSLYHEFCPGTLLLDVDPVVDCLCAELTVTDNTSYTGWTQGATVLNLIGPIITGSSPVYTLTNAGPSISTAGQDLYDSTYTWNISKALTNGNTTLVLTARGEKTPDCADFCQMLCALKEADAKVSNNASDRNKIQSLMLAWSKFNLAYDSQRCAPANVSGFMTQFWEQMQVFGITQDCDCCAACASTDGIIHPVCGTGGGSSSLEFDNTSPTWFTINEVGNTVTIGPSPQAIAYLASIRIVTVVSSDNSVDVTPTSVAGSATVPPSTEYDLSVAGLNQMSFFWTKNFDTGNASITNLTRLGNVWVAGNPTLLPAIENFLSVLRVSNLFTVDQQFKVEVNIVAQEPAKAFDLPLNEFNAIVGVSTSNLPVSATQNLFDIMFYDLAATDPVFRDIPIDYSGLSNYLDYITLQITIHQ